MSDRCWADLDARCPCVVRCRPTRRTQAQSDVPLEEQIRRLERVLASGQEQVGEFVTREWDAICVAARERLLVGHRSYGSRMYHWDEQTLRRNAIEEIADLLVYMSAMR